MSRPLRALLVEDSEDDALLVRRSLARFGFDLTCQRVDDRESMEAALDEPWDVVLSDYNLPRFSAPAALHVLLASGRDVPFLVISGAIGEERAVGILKAGAQDFLTKSNLARLGPAIERGLADADERRARRAAQGELAEREAHLSAVLESIADGVIGFKEDGQVETFNRAAEAIFGLPAAEAVGGPIALLLGETPGVETRTLRRTTADGTVHDLVVIVTAMPPCDPQGRRVAVVRDVTEERRMARELLEKESLARLGEMAAVVAHEVKNPLAGIKGAIEVIARRLGAGHGDHRILCQIVERVDALDETVGELLLFARPRPPRRSAVDLRRMTAEVIELLAVDPNFEAVEVALDGEATLEVDGDMFKPVLVNLLINAAQAMDGSGRIEIRIGPDFVEVADEGPGMAPEVLERVFEPFYTTKRGGSGLGLPTVRRVVEAHGGRLSVECPATGGTRVRIEIP